jgi:glycosyltransferase involved in cell wall biosynthesis
MPSPAQVAAAGRVGGGPVTPVDTLNLPALIALLARERPDVVLLACTGPVVARLTALPVLRGARRPVLLTGLPGISIPASDRAVSFRRSCDLFVVHSHRERREFLRVAAEVAPGLGFGLARLPFLPARPLSTDGAVPDADAPLVFASQARVPPDRADREHVLRALAAATPAVVKLRAGTGEQQTHHEEHPYDVLWADLVARGEVPAGAVTFATGGMAEAVAGSRGLVTVSSTAALEAIALGRPLLVADDFGVSEELINLVFEGSGCLGPMTALAGGGGLRTPDPGWLEDNYFHPEEDADWLVRLTALLRARREHRLPAVPAGPPTTGVQALRQYLRMALSLEDLARSERVLAALRLASRGPRALGRRARGRLRGRPGGAAPAGPPPAPPDARRTPPPASPPSPADRGR